MKAILVVDVEEYGEYYFEGRYYLKPMPQKKVVSVERIEDIQSCSITEVADKISAKIILKTNEVFALGWNACLEEIEK